MGEFWTSAWSQLALLGGSWSIVAGGLWKSSERAEKIVSAEGKDRTRTWLASLDIQTSGTSLANSFAHAFDAVFTRKHLSWQCFFRSMLSSYAFALTLGLGWFALANVKPSWRVARNLVEVVVFSSFLNVVPDYISLLKTRWIIGLLQQTTSGQIAMALIGLDAFLSMMVGIAGLAGFGTAFYFVATIVTSPSDLGIALVDAVSMFAGMFREYLGESRTVLLLEQEGPDATIIPYGIWLYVTFMTSIWVWLFATSSLIVRLARPLDVGAKFLRRWFDYEKQPFLAIGAMSIVIVTCFYLLAVPFVILF